MTFSTICKRYPNLEYLFGCFFPRHWQTAQVAPDRVLREFVRRRPRRRQKDSSGRDPKPYYLYMDEFQSFVSLDIADMLDQVRKFGLFAVLSHQRFGHLDENITDAVLTNCRIKAVFGGLPAPSAQMMAQELFIRKLDPKKIKAAIYQTKFWPKYGRDKVYTHSSTSGHSSSTGGGESSSVSSSAGDSTAYFYDDWFAVPQMAGTRAETTSRGNASMSGRSTSWGESDSFSESNSEADIPIFIPVPFQELSSMQYYTIEEQLLELTAALKEQFPRHCFIKVHNDETQPMLVPKVESFYTAPTNIKWWQEKALAKHHALPAVEVDRLIAERELALLQETQAKVLEGPVIDVEVLPPAEPEVTESAQTPSDTKSKLKNKRPTWNRSV